MFSDALVAPGCHGCILIERKFIDPRLQLRRGARDLHIAADGLDVTPDFTGTSTMAEIMVHESGKFVYGSNRGHNSIVGFRIGQTTGELSLIGWTSTQGAIPRGFNIDPSGRLMLVGNQNSDTVVPFRINQRSGKLRPTGAVTRTPAPVSFAFGRAKT